MSKTVVIFSVSFAMLAVGCRSSYDQTETQNIDVIRAVFSEVWSKGNVELIDEYFAADYVGHFPAETFNGRRGIRNHVTAHRTAFPDWKEDIEDMIVDGDRIAVRFSSSGTNLGEFLDTPPTGGHVMISEAAIFKLKDGEIVEQWVYPDILSLQRQLRSQEP